MSQPVNLNRFRKQKVRAAKKARADENVVKFGQNAAEKQTDKAGAVKAARHIESHKRDDT